MRRTAILLAGFVSAVLAVAPTAAATPEAVGPICFKGWIPDPFCEDPCIPDPASAIVCYGPGHGGLYDLLQCHADDFVNCLLAECSVACGTDCTLEYESANEREETGEIHYWGVTVLGVQVCMPS